MLRISKLTDYAVVLTTHLADTAGVTSVRALAEGSAIPEPTVAKVLKTLAKAGLVDSVRGAHGGYRLAREATAITVAEIIEAIEGPIAVTECVDAESECSLEEQCGVRANWQRINDAVATALQGITLAEMARPDAPRLFQIRKADSAETARSITR